MNSKHKLARQIAHWSDNNTVQCQQSSDFSTDEFRIKPELVIPKTRITEDDFQIFRESVAEKMCKEFSQVDLMKRLIVEVGQESLRLAIKHGDVKL